MPMGLPPVSERAVGHSPDFVAGKAADSYPLASGSPAMGSEQLEEDEFEPMFESCKAALKGKRIALFGSYGWGDGEWMRTWEETCRGDGAELACEPVICNEAPDEDALSACQALGKALV